MKLLIVIVLYETKLEDSSTYQSLQVHLPNLKGLNYQIFLYDNSLHSQNILDSTLLYIHDKSNPGIAQAYNNALDYARIHEYEWLLLLDQDSTVTLDHLRAVRERLHTTHYSPVAIAPRVCAGTQQISPVQSDTLRPLQEKEISAGIYKQNRMCICSGTAINTKFLDLIGGFNPEFPLDYLDHWLFWKIFNSKEKIEILPEQMHHDLSVLNLNTLSIKRYQSILQAEALFYKKYQTNLYSSYKLHLFARFFKQLLFLKNKKLAYKTFLAFFSF